VRTYDKLSVMLFARPQILMFAQDIICFANEYLLDLGMKVSLWLLY